MEIKIKNDKYFKKLLNALSSDIIDGEIYFKLYKDINNSISQYHREFNQSSTFWSLTRKSLIDATLLRLCRVYDENTKSLSLCNFIDTIKCNLYIFNVECFRDRLRGNPFVESLTSTAVEPDVTELLDYRKKVTSQDVLVKKLIIWRNNVIAHATAENIVKGNIIPKQYSITYNNISTLLDRATEILNKYSYLFSASRYSTQVVGHDDFLHVLESVKYHLDNYYFGELHW